MWKTTERENLGTSTKNQGITEGVPRHSSPTTFQTSCRHTEPHQHEIVEEPGSKPTFRAPYRLSPHGASRHEETDHVSPRKRTHPTIHFAIQCPSTLHTKTRPKRAHVHRLPSSQQADHQEQIPNSTKSMTCLTSFAEPRYFPNWICGPDTGR
ncbi:hypothetical protein CLOM_g22641 [Closterium sp. NIES-68]|nr:hypothetical protein CLOM_g22641 [Closterium sp. NIES-68]